MARLSSVPDVDSENEASRSTKPKSSNIAQGRAKGDAEEGRSTDAEGEIVRDEEGEDEEEEEEEYEIEAILDAQRGKIKKNEYAYLVKWKGYGEEHNSWVTHSDAGNAQELINDYLRRNAKSKVDRNSLPNKGKTSSPAVTSSAASKRGRGRPQKNVSDDESGAESRQAKKQKAGTNGKHRAVSSREPTDSEDVQMDDAEEPLYKASKETQLSKLKNWEKWIKQVSTVETVDGTLMVYFETIDGKLVREPSDVCKERFPLKLFEFYESHLRWKANDA